MDGNIYFAKKQQFYKFNEFIRTVTEAGKFNINVLNVEETDYCDKCRIS